MSDKIIVRTGWGGGEREGERQTDVGGEGKRERMRQREGKKGDKSDCFQKRGA